MKENKFQSKVIHTLKTMFPGCMVIKLDPNYIQGVPDLMVLNKDKWATLECKRSKDASHRPNQDYYVTKMDDMAYSSYIYPENEQEVYDELRKHFKTT